MKISILLPYKENYSVEYAGAVSIFVSGVNEFSKFNQNIKVYGNTDYTKNYQKIMLIFLSKKNIFKVLQKFM